MSARPDIPAEDAVTVEINGEPFQARKGAMIIEVTDAAGISVPRFCYHKKLSIAANCRMCMVEVEKAPKPLPACATPVAEGMKIFTQSDLAKGAQKAIMEFLLINHPLDCPICDQGGECELQDLALGYGAGVSRFAEKKRVVPDKFIGSLIATDMTRCIHCTRCIRMLREVAGKMELGATGRGENMEIGTYIEKSLDSELSGNVIDVCPVGALTSKPFRFKARAWELQQHVAVAPHDCIGSNLLVHTRRGEVMRVVPRENEEINEVWLSDRDRFSYAANGRPWTGRLLCRRRLIVYVRLLTGTGRSRWVCWCRRQQHSKKCLCCNHRLRQADFTDQQQAPVCPSLGQSLESLEAVNAALVIGSNTRKDQPIAGHRLRKAALNGAQLMFVNPVDFEFLFDVHAKAIVPPSQMVNVLAGIAACFPDAGSKSADAVKSMISGASPDKEQRAMAAALKEADSATVLLGSIATAHPHYSLLKALAAVIAAASGAILGILPDAANSAGGWLAGVLPHRGPAGSAVAECGMTAEEMLTAKRKGYLLFGVEPGHDCASAAQATAAATAAIAAAECVVSISPWASDAMKAAADVLLPIGPFTETSGTLVNAEGRWQSFQGVASPVGESRPGWKVLRVLGNQFGLDGFEQTSSEQIRDALREQLGSIVASATRADGLERIGDTAIYSSDALVRRAGSLQATPDASSAGLVRMNSQQAGKADVRDEYTVTVTQGENSVTMDVQIDESVPDNCVRVQAGTAASAALGAAFGPIKIQRV